jgi:hypothetical protein
MTVTIDGTNGITSPDFEVDGVTGRVYPIVSGTAVTASGTSVDFTGIPSWVKRVTVMFNGVSTSGTSNRLVQIGSGSITSSGYQSSASGGATAVTTSTSTAGFIIDNAVAAADTISTVCFIVNVSGNIWVSSGTGTSSAGAFRANAGNVTLSGTLDRVRITTVNGTDTFDAGSINILYE